MSGKIKILNIIIPVCLLLITFGCSRTLTLSPKTEEIFYLSGQGKDDAIGWEFFCTGGNNRDKWDSIPVPSNWELHGYGTYNYGRDRKKASEQGKYRKHFNIPEIWSDKRIFIVFEGVMTDTEVLINGQSAGPKHQGGFYRFKYEITNMVTTGDNLLEVTVSKASSDNSVEQAERMADYWTFGGIYRPVYLQVVPKEFIERTAIDARADGTFSIDIYLNGQSPADKVKVEISERSGSRLSKAIQADITPGQQKITLQTQVSEHKLWSAETPNLYQARVSLIASGTTIHSVTERFGFRTFEVRPGDGLYLNGQKIRLKGINRHCFWPDSGRCLSRNISYDDARLIKEMNMNAVRMSHYPPDTHFLDACDELGLYVLDELAGWQKPPYDTEIGKQLVKEMITRDVSHPCILFWDNGNEGGWNRELDSEFALYDPQNRTVLHPWANFNNIDTDHYETYESVINKLRKSILFMPTELLHGLYDGGHGAGLNDYWKIMYASPMGAGIFLWALVDEGVVRTDRAGEIDVAGSQAPDGIVGPYREKEGSFYTVKEIFSPVHIPIEKLPEDFDGQLEIENRFDFINLSDCTFEVKLGVFPIPERWTKDIGITYSYVFEGPDIESHNSGTIALPLPENYHDAEVLFLTATDPSGKEIWTWSWDMQDIEHYPPKIFQAKDTFYSKPTAISNEDEIIVNTGQSIIRFSNINGELLGVTVQGVKINFGGGPKLINGSTEYSKRKVGWTYAKDSVLIRTEYHQEMNYINWLIHPTGWVELEYEFELEGEFELLGVNFNYPERKVERMSWVGKGPYRVWKNRTKGGRFGLWSNDYKNHIPGVTWDFPEFKGYYRDWRWVEFTTEEGTITIANGTDDLYLGVYRPNDGPEPLNTGLNIPDTGIALLNGISPIGTKFLQAHQLGPEGRLNQAYGKYSGHVYFYFDN